MSPWSPAAIAPLPPGIRITLARGAFGLISTAREPPMLTVSSASAEPQKRPKSIAAAAKWPIPWCRFIVLPDSISSQNGYKEPIRAGAARRHQPAFVRLERGGGECVRLVPEHRHRLRWWHDDKIRMPRDKGADLLDVFPKQDR